MAKRPSNAIDLIRKSTGVDARNDSRVQAFRRAFEIGQIVYDARTAAGLTPSQLARRLGIRTSVITQLENADYDGKPLPILERIADALNLELELRLIPSRDPAQR